MQSGGYELGNYMTSLCKGLEENYRIPADEFQSYNIKRGLRNSDGTGVIAGVTRVGSVQGYVVRDSVPVPVPGKLIYRGVDLEDIVEAHTAASTFGFEETAFLLLFGYLPNSSQLSEFKEALSAARRLPDSFTEDMILRAPSKNIMNKLARGVLALYSYDDEADNLELSNVMRQCLELVARFPVIVANAYATKKHYYDGESLRIHMPKDGLSVSENFLHMLRPDNSFTDEEAKLLDLMLVLHAEHGGGNNSTFTARVLSSSQTDTYSAIAGAVCSLKGPLHGGANQKVMEMFHDIRAHVKDESDDEEISAYLGKMMDGTAGDGSGKIYGMGHAVYTVSDPRAILIKKYARNLAKKTGYLDEIELLEAVERCAPAVFASRKGGTKKICANVDMFSGMIYEMLGIPEDLYTPLFAVARVTGWCAHRVEEMLTGGRIMRPAYRSASADVTYTDIASR